MSVPHRYSEASFRRYEPVIAAVLAKFPETLTFPTEPLSPNTYACRLRDALRAVEIYRYPSTIDLEKLKAIRAKFIILTNADSVTVGPRKQKELSPIDTTTPLVSNIIEADDAVLQAYCVLLHNRLHAPVTLRIPNPALLTSLQGNYDISVTTNEDGTYTIY